MYMVLVTEYVVVAWNVKIVRYEFILVSSSPNVEIFPTIFIKHLQHAEEYRQSPAFGTFVRWVRFLAVLTSIFLLPLWMLGAMDPALLPKSLSFIGPDDEGNIPLSVQIIMALVGIKLDRKSVV